MVVVAMEDVVGVVDVVVATALLAPLPDRATTAATPLTGLANTILKRKELAIVYFVCILKKNCDVFTSNFDHFLEQKYPPPPSHR